MIQSRIAELLEPFLQTGAYLTPLAPTQLNHISTYVDLLIRWNARVNLTAIRTPDEIVTRHFGESLFAARHLFPGNPANHPRPLSSAEAARHPLLVDLGSGAGFPGLPVKIWSPQTAVTLIESNHKKVAFLREVIRELTLMSIDVFPGRAEAFPAQAATLALLISRTQIPQAQSLAPHLLWSTPIPIPQSTSRILLTAKTQPAEPEQ